MTRAERLFRKPNVSSVPSVPAPPAFLEDEEGEGSEWGWSDWDGVDIGELRRQTGFHQ
jgi:hypothetical protein